MGQNRQLFKPWLRQQIDSGQYPGVCWCNEERTLFSIPWKHALRHDRNSDDILIFKAWAQTSASSGENVPGDPSVWKRNFRSTLRARDFTMVEDCKNDAANPHKVYRWPENDQSGESQDTSSDSRTLNLNSEDSLYLGDDELFPDGQSSDLLEQCLRGLNIDGSQTESQSSSFFMGENVENTEVPVLGTINFSDFSPVEGAVGGVGHNCPDQYTLAHNPYSPLQGASQHNPQTSGQITSIDPGNVLQTDFNVIVYYKGVKVMEQLVHNDSGFQLVPKKGANQMTNGLPAVELPDTNCILDQTQAILTYTVLSNLGGLSVIKHDGKLLGSRLGESHVYYTLNKHDQTSEPRELPKNQQGVIYSMRDFISELIQFIEKGGECPSYSIFFFLGEKWPDPKNRPWDKKLIMVEVVLTALEQIKKLAVVNGASSQSSVELQISLEQMMDLF